MKHFLVDIQYLVSYDQISLILSDHRAFLQTGYDKGILLMSGPNEPQTGGYVIARSETIEEIQSFFKADPYNIKNVASYKFLEFNPVKFQPFLKNWIEGD